MPIFKIYLNSVCKIILSHILCPYRIQKYVSFCSSFCRWCMVELYYHAFFKVSDTNIMLLFKSDWLPLFQLEIYFEPAILNGFCRLVYVGLYDDHAKVQWSSWAKVWYVICAKVLWMMGDCRSPVVKTRTQNLLTPRSGLHKWS